MKNFNMKIKKLVVLILLLIINSRINAQLFEENWQMLSFDNNIGKIVMECIDTNNDKKDEIFIVGPVGTIKLSYLNNNYFVAGYGDLYSNWEFICADLYNDAEKYFICTINKDGEVVIYDALDLNITETFYLFDEDFINEKELNDIAPIECKVVDLNNDSIMELVVIGYEYLMIVDVQSKNISFLQRR